MHASTSTSGALRLLLQALRLTCTLRMHTARGTLTTELPSAAAAPAVKAVAPSLRSVRSRRKRLVVE